MRNAIVTVKADGRAEANAAGVGFRVRPAVTPKASADYARAARPGSYPVRVRIDGQGEALNVVNADSYYFAEGGRFRFLQVVDGEAGDVWQFDVFESREEGQTPAGRPARAPFELAPLGTAVPTAVPAVAGDGFLLRPGQRKITVYFAGALTTATLWVRQLDGTWFDLNESIDPTGANPRFDTRELGVPGDRFYLRAAAGGMTMKIEVDAEVG